MLLQVKFQVKSTEAINCQSNPSRSGSSATKNLMRQSLTIFHQVGGGRFGDAKFSTTPFIGAGDEISTALIFE